MSSTSKFKRGLDRSVLGITNSLKKSWDKVQEFSSLHWGKMKTAIEIDGGGNTCPQAETVVLSLAALFIFFIIAIIAIQFPTIATRHAVLAINAILAGALGIIFARDVITSKSTKHETELCTQSC